MKNLPDIDRMPWGVPFWKIAGQMQAVLTVMEPCQSIFHSSMVTAKWQVVLNLPSQHKLCILQRLMVQQPVQFCPLCRGVAVFVLHGDAVDGKGSATLEPGFHPVGVHVVAAGKQFVHKEPSFYIKVMSVRLSKSLPWIIVVDVHLMLGLNRQDCGCRFGLEPDRFPGFA